MLNLTQHPATADQIAVGVVDLAGDELGSLKSALTFGELPNEQEIGNRAAAIAGIAVRVEDPAAPQDALIGRHYCHDRAMIGGALWLMAPLAAALRRAGIEPVFAFSVRETEEQRQPDGSVRKVTVFRHAGFVPAI